MKKDKEIINSLQALIKGYIYGVLSLVKHDKAFSPWRRNFKYLERCIAKKDALFKIEQNIKNIAYVTGKGDLNVVSIARDNDYLMNREELIVVIMHEIAHLSVPEYRHTHDFHEMNSVLLFAANLLFRIDTNKIVNEEIGNPEYVREILRCGRAHIVVNNPGTLYRLMTF